MPLVTSSPERLSGAPVFAGTRVPVKALFDYLEAGDPLEEFLTDFPNVTRAHAVAVLEFARRKVTGGDLGAVGLRMSSPWIGEVAAS